MDVVALVAGLVCGVLTGFGIGGGSLLMVWMTAVAGLSPTEAAGINLLYFLPTALSALFYHQKHGLIRRDVQIPAALFGCMTAVLGVLLAAVLDAQWLRRIFGSFLLLTGSLELKKSR